LALARGELEHSLDMEIFNLAEVLQRIAREYPGLMLVIQDPGEIAGNRQRMAQLVCNLVRNAVQATGSTKQVSLELNQQQKQVVLTVRDQGKGIAAEDLPHVFKRFYSRHGGSGLGLSVAQHIAKQHGGLIPIPQLGDAYPSSTRADEINTKSPNMSHLSKELVLFR
jgi:signal transduction histidine kinase